MEYLVRTLVVVALTLVMAGACGGREEQNAENNAVANPGGNTTAPEGTGGNSIVDSSGKLNLTPKQSEDLLRVREEYIRRNAAKGKRSSFRRIESEDGSGIALPSNFPADIPIYAGSVPMQHISSANAGTMTIFESEESPDSARRHLSNALTNEGWSIISDMSDEGLTMMTAEKDGREISVSILIDGDTTKITTFQN